MRLEELDLVSVQITEAQVKQLFLKISEDENKLKSLSLVEINLSSIDPSLFGRALEKLRFCKMNNKNNKLGLS